MQFLTLELNSEFNIDKIVKSFRPLQPDSKEDMKHVSPARQAKNLKLEHFTVQQKSRPHSIKPPHHQLDQSNSFQLKTKTQELIS